MYRNILVPLDGSDFAERALPLALSIAERTEGELQIVSAVPTLPPVVPSPDDEGPVRGWFEEEKVRAAEYLEQVAADLRDTTSVAVHTRVLSGDPAQTVDERARKTGAELVVMTTHGRGPFERAWLGSVADGLVRRSPCPILLSRPDQAEEERGVEMASRTRFERILVPLDGSDESASILPRAAGLARLFEARLSLLSVVPDPVRLASSYLPHAARENVEHEEVAAEARRYVEEVAARLRDEGVESDAEVVLEDDPGSAILAYRAEVGADLVAMSTRGRGGVSRLVLGSVADKVVRGARVPVLVHRREAESD